MPLNNETFECPRRFILQMNEMLKSIQNLFHVLLRM